MKIFCNFSLFFAFLCLSCPSLEDGVSTGGIPHSDNDSDLVELLDQGLINIVDACWLGPNSLMVDCERLTSELNSYLEARDNAERLADIYNDTRLCSDLSALVTANLSIESRLFVLLESQTFEDLHATGYVRFPPPVDSACKDDHPGTGKDEKPYLPAWGFLVIVFVILAAGVLCMVLLYFGSCKIGLACVGGHHVNAGGVGQYNIQVDSNPTAAVQDVSILSGFPPDDIIINIDASLPVSGHGTLLQPAEDSEEPGQDDGSAGGEGGSVESDSAGVTDQHIVGGLDAGQDTGNDEEENVGPGAAGVTDQPVVNDLTAEWDPGSDEEGNVGAVDVCQVGGVAPGVGQDGGSAGSEEGSVETIDLGGNAGLEGGEVGGQGLEEVVTVVPAVSRDGERAGGHRKATAPPSRQIPTRSRTGALAARKPIEDCRRRVH